ncbi:VCBS domain-containing protein [Vibrio chagasii]|nr:VCBS domain-containing protein [Vibrio chagasii]
MATGDYVLANGNPAVQALKQGETGRCYLRGLLCQMAHHRITITVTGTNDAPTVTKVALNNGTEDTHYQMQASQFLDSPISILAIRLHSIAITDLPPATQGKFVLMDTTSPQVRAS